MAGIERIREVAKYVLAERAAGHQVVVVVSAMAGTTDQLFAYASALNSLPMHADAAAEFDAVLTAGEQITAGLVALALQQLGIAARSYLAWQLPLHSSAQHLHGSILDIDIRVLQQALLHNIVPVIAGYQGLHAASKRVVTLGRGGSDTSAVAVAAALGAKRCDIFTDVDGVYSADPRLVPKARKLKEVASSEMLELASLGAKVLHPRAVQLAMHYHVPLQVRSSFSQATGTFIIPDFDRDPTMEPHDITGLAYVRGENLFTITSNLPVDKVLEQIMQHGISSSGILQHTSDGPEVRLYFSVNDAHFASAETALQQLQCEGAIISLHSQRELAKLSTIGIGMQHPLEVAKRIFITLAEKNIPHYFVSAAEIRVSTLIPEAQLELAMRSLHECFELEE